MAHEIDDLLSMGAIAESILEGAEYLHQHPGYEPLNGDVKLALESLNACVPDNLKYAGEAEVRRIRTWYTLFTNWVGEELNSAIVAKESLLLETVEKIISFIEAAKLPDEILYTLLLNFSVHCGSTAPDVSFACMMQVFEKQPAALSAEGTAHPGYIYKEEPQKTFTKCPVCGGEGIPFYNAFSYVMKDFRHPFLPAKLWMKCQDCRNLYTFKFPEAFLKKSLHKEWITPQYDPDKTMPCNSTLLSAWGDVLNKLQKYSDSSQLLEVGVGDGSLVAVALELGYEVDAIEIEKETSRRVADVLNVSVWNGDFLEFESDKSYGMITMGDVIEHVTDPKKALRKAHSLLEEDGVLWLSTPNFEGAFARFQKFQDPMWKEPYHITWFSYQGLVDIAKQCGFTVVEHRVSSHYNGSMELIFTKTKV